MALDLQYSLTLDATRWLPVPLSFPWGEFSTPQEWAATLTASLLDGTGAEQVASELLMNTALTLQAMDGPLPGASERFWRTEYVGGRAIVAHLYISELEVASIEDLVQLARAGLGGIVQTWGVIDDTPFSAAISATVVAEIDGADVGAIRWLGVRDGLVFIVELLDEDPLVLEAVQSEMDAVFRSIRFA